MVATKFYPHKFNGFLFQQNGKVDSDFVDFDWDIRGLSTSNTPRHNNRPKYSGMSMSGVVKVVNVTLANAERDRDELVLAMDIGNQTQLPLYALDKFGNEYFCLAKCVGLNPDDIGDGEGTNIAGSFGYIFEIDDPTWISTKTFEDIWDIVADGDIYNISVGGNQFTKPIFEITPGSPVGYWPYTEYIKNYNPIALAQNNESVDITAGGWDTAALILANKMEADGRDVRVYVDGAEWPYWFGGTGIDTSTTKVFIRGLTWKPGQFMPLRVALPNNLTATLIQWAVTTAVKTALGKLPKSGIVRVENEEISYKNLNSTTCQAEIVARNIRGTALAAHSIGVVCWWVEHDIKIIYGNNIAIAPTYADTYKPVFDLSTSTNTSRVNTVAFADTQNLRPGSWIRQVLNDGLGKLNRVYSGNQAAIADVDPATEMGMEIASYQVQGKVKPETAELAWMLYHPAEITNVTTTGEKFRSFTTTSWPTAAELQSSKNGTAWVREWNEVTPASPNTWTALANTSTEAIPAGSTYVRFHFKGSINALVDNFVRMEIDSVTYTLNSAKIIQLGMSGEQASYQFGIEFRNNRTEQSIFIDYPAKEAEPIIVDTDAFTVTYRGMNALRGLSWDSVRTDWLRLLPGDNELQYFAEVSGALQVKIRRQNRAA
jgi:hypothetical protein